MKRRLKTGMVVTLQNGQECTVFKEIDSIYTNTEPGSNEGIILNASDNYWFKLSRYDNELRYSGKPSWDIVKVERVSHPFAFVDLDHSRGIRELIWERTPAIDLTLKQIEDLLGYPIRIVEEVNEVIEA
jgi:hypothetical protein